jgi:exosortase A
MNQRTTMATRPAGPATAIAIGLLVLATLWLYRETAASLVALWGRSETFAHGYMVPLIVAWLLWRKRKELAAAVPGFKPSPSALIAVAAVAGLWLVGDIAEVNPARQFALVAFIVLTVPALVGWRAAGVVAFPLAFLFFAVPFGDFLLPWLMAGTADFTVLALRASGVPVYRDGLQFVIPSGSWSVVEACSGVRYLIASVMVGALFAYLHYRTTRRRLLFMLVALAVPIVANWVRAYMIVMIGHLSNNVLAVGVDHLIYGWIFFGVVISIMFLIGSRWSESAAPPAPGAPARACGARTSAPTPLWPTATAMGFLLLTPLLLVRSLTAAEDHSAPVLAVPALSGVTVVADTALPPWAPAFSNPSATVERRFAMGDRAVGLYIGYYRGQGPHRKLVSSANALVRSDAPAWVVTESGRRSIDLGQGDLVVRTSRLRRHLNSSDGTRLAVWQTYWVDGRFEPSDARAKAWGGWQRLRGRGDDGAVLIVYALEQGPGEADAVLEAFLRQNLAAIDTQLKKTRDGD